ncbi:hypothetical protein EV694_1721 [Volucribacter psittacicida]|uniref:Uncharacterized protein n=1 Tax=Volucribacter psittacicida TaxID=203482 RepID=A0A4R1FRS6_9PAST|nr:hypothetical protein [Volucribacter psittacicida]TCJ96169.1 hypothetical protein EV694_1721 [Volucribacter psittacicida]
MEFNQHIKLAEQLLKQNKCVIYQIFEKGIMAVFDKKETRTSIVCSAEEDGLMVSISVNGRANLKISQKFIQKIFGKRYAVERHLNKIDGQQANYFKLTVLRA